MQKKENDLSPSHLKWLIDRRSSIQMSCADLYDLMDIHSELLHSDAYLNMAEALVAICFSLWRAAFLTDKETAREEVFKDGHDFLGTILSDNSIAFSHDRMFRNWTFNYYVSNAENRLRYLCNNRPEFKGMYQRQDYESGPMPKSKFRWDECQKGLDQILGKLRNTLEAAVK